ncbi:MAG TPA: AbrB/MazE/SpoVT family DNA-binding domain-containing protein [Pseudogracilibacillus sp.]|nr:AbrB/MazE/SpoVT family DNA-binding domain-containing protein [Pseudogracilibacillus sp.]
MEKYRRKVTKIGNSYGVTFPKELLKEAKISYGDNVSVELKDGKIVLQREEEIKLPDGVDSEFMETLTDVIKEHETAFKGLVDR